MRPHSNASGCIFCCATPRCTGKFRQLMDGSYVMFDECTAIKGKWMMYGAWPGPEMCLESAEARSFSPR